MKLSAHDLRIVSEWNESLEGAVELLLTTGEDARSRQLEEFARHLQHVASRVRLRVQSGKTGDLPAFRIGNGWIHHAVPGGRELQPFLKILSFNGAAEPKITASVKTFLDEITSPALLRLYVAPQCVYCPHVVNALAPLPFHNQRLQIELYDVLMFPEVAERSSVKAVPVLMYGDDFRWTGSLHLQEVLQVVAERDLKRLGAPALVQMLKEGNAEKLAEMMIEAGSVFPAFLEVLAHPEWSVRLGAMVTVEAIAERNPQLAASVLEPLWNQRSGLEMERLGDIVYLIGELGSSDWIARLEPLLETAADSQLREVIAEALAALAHRRSP